MYRKLAWVRCVLLMMACEELAPPSDSEQVQFEGLPTGMGQSLHHLEPILRIVNLIRVRTVSQAEILSSTAR